MRLAAHVGAVLSIVIAATLFAPVARACSMQEGYRTPTNFELLERAELVVLGRLQFDPPAQSDRSGIGAMTLQPLRVLKGALPDQPLAIMGDADWNGVEIPSLPTSLGQSHFSAGLGACVRIFYPRGGLILAMFERSSEGWTQSWAAFARTVEDVESEDGFWVRAAEAYLGLQERTPPPQRRQAVQAWLAELEGSAPNSLNQAMAADLRHHLAATSGTEEQSTRPFWTLLNMPAEAAAVIVGARLRAGGDGPSGAIACFAGRGTLSLIAHRTQQVVDISVVIGDRRFDAEAEQAKSSFGEQYVEGEVPLSDELIEALSSPVARAGLRIGGTSVEAPPAEVLPLLARQCQALRTRPPLPESARAMN